MSKIKTTQTKTAALLISFISIFGTAALIPAIVSTSRADAFGNDYLGCAAGRPCIDNISQNNRTLTVHWKGHENYDAYNFRWSRPGKSSPQVELGGGRSGERKINNIHPQTTYTLSVQGCTKHFLSRSTCSPWESRTFISK